MFCSAAEERRVQYLSETEVPLATILQVKEFFGSSSNVFSKEWKELSQQEKDWFKHEVGKTL